MFPASYLGFEVPGSESFYKDPLVQNNDMKIEEVQNPIMKIKKTYDNFY